MFEVSWLHKGRKESRTKDRKLTMWLREKGTVKPSCRRRKKASVLFRLALTHSQAFFYSLGEKEEDEEK